MRRPRRLEDEHPPTEETGLSTKEMESSTFCKRVMQPGETTGNNRGSNFANDFGATIHLDETHGGHVTLMQGSLEVLGHQVGDVLGSRDLMEGKVLTAQAVLNP